MFSICLSPTAECTTAIVIENQRAMIIAYMVAARNGSK